MSGSTTPHPLPDCMMPDGAEPCAGWTAVDQLMKAAVAECQQYERMLSAVRKANEDWSRRYYALLGDHQRLVYSALGINDHLRLNADHAEFTGSMNDAQNFGELANEAHNKRIDEFTDHILDEDAAEEVF